MNKENYTVKSVYRRYMEGFGLAYQTKRHKGLDLQEALALLSKEIKRDDIKEVSIEDASKRVENVKNYPIYEVSQDD